MKMITILIIFTRSNILNDEYEVKYEIYDEEIYIILENEFFLVQARNNFENTNIYKSEYSNTSNEFKLGIILKTERKHRMNFFFKNSKQINFSTTIPKLNDNSGEIDIQFLKGNDIKKDPDFVTIFTNSSDFLTFSNQEAEINFKVINSTNNEIITQILRKRSRNKLIICYGGNNCFYEQDFQIQSDENYLTSINESTFLEIIKQFIPSTGLKSFKIIFNNNETPPIDFSIIPFKIIEKVELIGHSETRPQFIKLTNHDQKEIKTKLKTRNIQFLNDNVIFINHNNNKKKKNALDNSPSLLNQVIIPIDPQFTENQNITFLIGKETLNITGTQDEIAYIGYIYNRENIYRIRDVTNTGYNNTIFIKPNPNIRYVAINTISILVENCDPISIQFSGWENNNSIPDIMFHFYSEKETDLNIISSKNRKIKYRHLSYNDPSLVFYEYPSAFVFCISNAPCDRQEFIQLDPIQVQIDIENLSLIEKEFDDITKVFIRNLILCLNNNSKGIEFSFPYLKGENLKNIQFINYDEDNINIKIKDFNTIEDNKWELTNCTVDVISEQYTIAELVSINSFIRGNYLNIKHGTFIKNVDLIDDDINFTISSSNYFFEIDDYKYKETDNVTLKIKTIQNPTNTVRFTPADKNPCGINLNFEGVDENSTEFLLFFENNWSHIENVNNKQILINVSSMDHIAINKIPENIDFVVYSKELEKCIQQVYVNSSILVMCYESNECSKQAEFMISNETTFISTKTKENYDQIIESIEKIDKNYKYLKYIFIDTEKVIKFNYSQIPSEKFDQLQLYGWKEENVKLLLDDKANTSSFCNWVIHHVSFVENLNIKYYFNEITVIDTDPIFQNVYKYSDNITIGTARFHCGYNQKIDGLSSIYSINYTTYELFPEIDVNDYILSIKGYSFIANSNLENGNGNPIITPINNKFNFIIHAPSNPINSTLYICRYDNYFNEVSIIFDNFEETVPIKYVCKSDECEKPFHFNFTIDNIYLIKINQEGCYNANTTLNGNNTYPLPTEYFSESIQFSYSNLFSFSSVFSESMKFNATYQFSESFKFSKSSQFSRSSQFSESYRFSETFFFSESYLFSESNLFTISSKFTNSKPFTKSSKFTPSHTFTSSSLFSLSSLFSQSSSFSESIYVTTEFSFSNYFTKSMPFSMTSEFTQTQQFTPSFPFQHDQPTSDLISQIMNVDSSVFNMTSKGFINEKNYLSDLSHFTKPLTTIFFTSKNIYIAEREGFSLPMTLCFSARRPESSIRINKNLYNSVVGIKTDNSPTIILMNQESPINIMNYKQGYSTIDIIYENKTYDFGKVSLTMNEVNNSNGYFTINVDPKIKSLSFTTILMSRISSLEARYKSMTRYPKSNLHLLDNNNYEFGDIDDERVEIIAEKEIKISHKSNVILSTFVIKGQLNIYEDSSLTLKEGTIFSDQSVINFIFLNSKSSRKEPIIRIESLLNSSPSEIILTFEGKSKSSDISDFVLLEATNFKTCLSWIDKVKFPNNDKRKFGIKCKYAEGGATRFVFNAKKNKLSKTAIIGIAVGCAVVILIIIIIIVVVRKKSNHNLSELENSDH